MNSIYSTDLAVFFIHTCLLTDFRSLLRRKRQRLRPNSIAIQTTLFPFRPIVLSIIIWMTGFFTLSRPLSQNTMLHSATKALNCSFMHKIYNNFNLLENCSQAKFCWKIFNCFFLQFFLFSRMSFHCWTIKNFKHDSW
jgi:hypothetical protein